MFIPRLSAWCTSPRIGPILLIAFSGPKISLHPSSEFTQIVPGCSIKEPFPLWT